MVDENFVVTERELFPVEWNVETPMTGLDLRKINCR